MRSDNPKLCTLDHRGLTRHSTLNTSAHTKKSDSGLHKITHLRSDVISNEHYTREALSYAIKSLSWFPFKYIVRNSKLHHFSLSIEVSTIVVLLSNFKEETGIKKLMELLPNETTLIFAKRTPSTFGVQEPEDYIKYIITPKEWVSTCVLIYRLID